MPGADDASHIEAVHDAAVGDLIDLGDHFRPGNPGRVAAEHHVFLVQTGKGHKGVRVFQPFLLQELRIRGVSVYDHGFGKELAQLVASRPVILYDAHLDPGAQKL